MNLDDIRNLFNYTEWANHLVLDAVERLSEEQRKHDFKISHGSIQGTLLHTAGAEWLWLERWRGTSHTGLWAAEDFVGIPAIRARWQLIEAERQSFIDSLSEDELSGDLSYRNLKGEPFTLPLVAQMQHVVNHSSQHRGQAVGMIRQLGVQPPAVDLLYYLIQGK